MKLLILGGTRFLGRHLADQALQRGHAVTLLHRGQSGPQLFPQAEHLIADRDLDLGVLDGRRWDAVIDTSAYVPSQVRTVVARLAGHVAHYQLVSSISAYASLDVPGTLEDAPLATLADPGVETVDGQTYGGLKALCEAAALQGFGSAACCIVRPGLLVGPFDPTGRWTWWVQRILRGGEVLAPSRPDAPVQFIDARDAAAWMLDQAERQSTGAFNLTGPAAPLTMGAFLDTACATLNPAARLKWLDETFLLEAGVAPWSDLPVWLPAVSQGLHQTSIARALATGLRCRPLAQTLLDTAAWASRPDESAAAAAAGPPRPAVGLAPEREAALLAAWQQQGRAAAPLRVAVMGAGAVGCYFGGLLARAGHDVVLIGRATHVQAIQAAGLRLQTSRFDEQVPVQASTDAAAARGAALVLFCVKSTDTASAAASLRPHLAADTLLLSLQNGVDNADRLRRLLPQPVRAAVVYVAAEMAGPGHVRHHGRGELLVEPGPGGADDDGWAEALRAAGVPVDLSTDVRQALWVKLILNCAYNALSAIPQMPYGRLLATAGVDEVMQAVVAECVAVAQAEGVVIPAEIDTTVRQLARSMPEQRSSTAQDLARGRPTEIDHLNGFVVGRGRAHGLPTPVNQTLQTLVHLLQTQPPRGLECP